jgi:hypothetical protein
VRQSPSRPRHSKQRQGRASMRMKRHSKTTTDMQRIFHEYF